MDTRLKNHIFICISLLKLRFKCLVGLTVEVYSVVKVISKKNNAYFVSTPFTNIGSIITDDDDTDVADNNDDDLFDENLLDIVVSVEKVHSLVIGMSGKIKLWQFTLA